MGFGFADFRRIGRAMDAVSLRRESDPVQPYGVVRPWLDIELLCRFHALELIFRMISVVRVGIGRNHLEAAARGRLFFAADGCRKEADQRARWVERSDGLTRFIDLDPADGKLGLLVADVGNRNTFAGAVAFLAGAQGCQQTPAP